MSDKTHFEVPLFDVGIDGAGFRVDNEPGELQRKHIDQFKKSDVSYQADLVAVVHGTMTPGGLRGVLLVIDFHFVSNPQGHRFRSVDITISFGREDLPVGGPKEPTVEQVAPHGTFGMDEATQSRVETTETHGSVQGGSGSLATLGIGGSYQRVTSADIKSYAMLHGMPWLEVRNAGGWNAAQWSLKENSTLKHGVPAHLRCAILLSLPDDARFRAELSVTGSLGTFQSKVKRRVGAKTGLQPVYFDPSSEKGRVDLGPALQDVDKTRLADCKLASMGSAKTMTILANPPVAPAAEVPLARPDGS